MGKHSKKNQHKKGDEKGPELEATNGSRIDNEVSKKNKRKVDDQEDLDQMEVNNANEYIQTQFREDSDVEERPVKKKKKKPQVQETETGTGKKQTKSIRQMKREKFAQRQAEAEVASKDQIKSQCLTYLSQWKHDKQNWKFMKVKQAWLYKNKFSQRLLPDASWPMLLEYFESAKGNIRNMLIEDANKVIKKMDEWVESHGNEHSKKENETEESEEKETSEKPDNISYKRARDLLQCLEE